MLIVVSIKASMSQNNTKAFISEHRRAILQKLADAQVAPVANDAENDREDRAGREKEALWEERSDERIVVRLSVDLQRRATRPYLRDCLHRRSWERSEHVRDLGVTELDDARLGLQESRGQPDWRVCARNTDCFTTSAKDR